MDIGDASISLSVCPTVYLPWYRWPTSTFFHFPRHVRVAAAAERMENFTTATGCLPQLVGSASLHFWWLCAPIIGHGYANGRFSGHLGQRRQIRQIGQTLAFFRRQIG